MFPLRADFAQTAYAIDNQPSVVRYPRGTGYGLEKLQSLFGYEIDEMPSKGEELEIGKGRIVRRPRASARKKAVILSLGTRLAPALEAAIQIEVGRWWYGKPQSCFGCGRGWLVWVVGAVGAPCSWCKELHPHHPRIAFPGGRGSCDSLSCPPIPDVHLIRHI